MSKSRSWNLRVKSKIEPTKLEGQYAWSSGAGNDMVEAMSNQPAPAQPLYCNGRVWANQAL